MNKKMIALMITLVILLVGVAALLVFNKGKSESDNNSNQSQKSNTNIGNHENDNNGENSNSKIAVIYFSATGTTESVAKTIQRATNGDIIEIVPKEEYTSADLNYNTDDSRANKEQNSSSARPKIANTINVEEYDTIYLGYPIWWGDVPKIILTFLDTYNLEGKTVILFCTSGGSSISTSMNTLKNYNNKVNWVDGKRFDSSTSQTEIENWMNSIKN